MNQYCLEPLVEFVDADDADELIPTLDTQMSVGMIICVCTVLIILALILLLWLCCRSGRRWGACRWLLCGGEDWGQLLSHCAFEFY